MRICLSAEAQIELESLARRSPDLAEGVRACIEMLSLDANEFEGVDGFSIKRVGGLFKRGVRVSRVKYENYIPSVRVLFFSIPAKDCIFISGIHRRGDLGGEYDFTREPFVRARRYRGMKEILCVDHD